MTADPLYPAWPDYLWFERTRAILLLSLCGFSICEVIDILADGTTRENVLKVLETYGETGETGWTPYPRATTYFGTDGMGNVPAVATGKLAPCAIREASLARVESRRRMKLKREWESGRA